MNYKFINVIAIVSLVLVTLVLIASFALIKRGFDATTEPSRLEQSIARFMRGLAITAQERDRINPQELTAENLKAGRDDFLSRCAICHGHDGSGRTDIGQNLYPRVPDLHSSETQAMTDGELHYTIENGIQLTGMAAWGNQNHQSNDNTWNLVLYIRSLQRYADELDESLVVKKPWLTTDASYVGSNACESCHADIYRRWKITPMANVVRNPREHPDAIIPSLETNTISPFTQDEVALVYGQLWKQRYFKKVGDDYYPLPVQWQVANEKWSKYHVSTSSDWWVEFYPEDNMERPTGPLCDGCHTVGYDINTKQPAELNVGCEGCHAQGSTHVANPARDNIINPARMHHVQATDTCIRCHSQGQPLEIPLEGKYYDWPVGYQVGLELKDFWKLEEHTLGETTFYHYADGTAHKNRMQGNDFVQSVMYLKGVTCFDCHDVHGTENYAQLRKPAETICMDCHGPMSPNGPHTSTIEEHTHHEVGGAGSQCVACHMPAIVSEGVPNANVHAHTFKFITPAMTSKYEIPNPCTMCHSDKPLTWATEAMRGWKEISPWRIE